MDHSHPHTFRKAGQLKHDISDFVDEFRPLINWRNDETDSLLDVGCAGGDVTVEVLQPILPKTFSRLIGVDISETMVKYASENFQIPKVSFDTLDISGDISEFKRKYETFDHIHSSATLNMIQEQNHALKNIYSLLKPNGDCILYILVESLFLESYRKLDKKKWGEWMTDIDGLISPYSQRHFPEEMLKKNLLKAGFQQCIVKERHVIPVYEDIQVFKDASLPIVKFYVNVPKEKEVEFMDDLADIVIGFKTSKQTFPWTDDKYSQKLNATDDQLEILAPYKVLVAYARK